MNATQEITHMRFEKAEIGVGIVGLGMGRNMFSAHQCPESTMRVRIVCDTDQSRLAAAAEKQSVATTTDFSDLLRRDDVDVIGIYTPDPLHHQQILAALEAGKHVICTKPMVTSLKQAQDILHAVRRSGKKLLVGQTCRFIRNYIAAKKLSDDGTYGRPLYVEATYNHDMRPVLDHTPWRYQMPQDVLFGGLCHPMDLALWIGGPIEELSAMSARSAMDARYPEALHDNFIVNLRFKSGALGRVIGLYGFSHAEGFPYIELTVLGSRGGSHQNRITLEDEHRKQQTKDILDCTDVAGVSVEGHSSEVLRYMLDFEKCLREDRDPDPGALAATRVSAALEAVRESTQSGRSSKVKWDF
jgi:predicted dehydrogenase